MTFKNPRCIEQRTTHVGSVGPTPLVAATLHWQSPARVKHAKRALSPSQRQGWESPAGMRQGESKQGPRSPLRRGSRASGALTRSRECTNLRRTNMHRAGADYAGDRLATSSLEAASKAPAAVVSPVDADDQETRYTPAEAREPAESLL